MSINTHKVYMKCPVCGEVTTAFDYHENTSSDNSEFFCVLNIGKSSNHIWVGNPLNELYFICSYCNVKTPYSEIFTSEYCKVEDIDFYKTLLRNGISWADKNGRVSFSDWNSEWSEEPALTRLIAMYPEDYELKRIQYIYQTMRMHGKYAITKMETNNKNLSRSMIMVPEELEKVYLGNNVEIIGSNTFEKCKKLKDIYIPDSVTAIGDFAFSESGLSKIHVSKKIISIGKRAFYKTDISKFFFPDDVYEIGEECFLECSYLNNIWLPAKVKVGKNAFAGCRNMNHVQISDSIPIEMVKTWGLSENCIIERY